MFPSLNGNPIWTGIRVLVAFPLAHSCLGYTVPTGAYVGASMPMKLLELNANFPYPVDYSLQGWRGVLRWRGAE